MLLRLCEVFNENVPPKHTDTRAGCHHGYSVVHISVSHMSLIPGRPSERDKQNPPMRLKLCNFDRLLTQIPQRMPKKKKNIGQEGPWATHSTRTEWIPNERVVIVARDTHRNCRITHKVTEIFLTRGNLRMAPTQ